MKTIEKNISYQMGRPAIVANERRTQDIKYESDLCCELLLLFDDCREISIFNLVS